MLGTGHVTTDTTTICCSMYIVLTALHHLSISTILLIMGQVSDWYSTCGCTLTHTALWLAGWGLKSIIHENNPHVSDAETHLNINAIV
jgi:hypothetical protein